MMNEEELQEKIFALVENQLAQSEADELRQLIASDEAAKKFYEETIAMHHSIVNSGRQDLLKQLKELDEGLPEIKQQSTKRRYLVRNIVVLAVAASVLIFMIIQFGNLQSPQNHLELFETYIASTDLPPLASGPRRGNESNDSLRLTAYNLYDKEEFAQAVLLFEQVIGSNEGSINDKLHLAVSYLMMGQSDRSIRALEDFLNSESDLTNEAHWYLGLGYLYKNEIEKALKQFAQVQEGHPLFEKARKLRRNLD